MKTSFLFLATAAAFVLLGCTETPKPSPAKPAAAPAQAAEPLVPLPGKVAVDMDKVLLGRRLFHDSILSGDRTLSCATCHSLDHGGAEPRKVSVGIRGQSGPINAPTVLNSGFNFLQFWDGRAKDLAEQALGPVANAAEMGADWESVRSAVAEDPWYKERFAKLYAGKVDRSTITHALAEYEKSLVTPSRFDKFLRGDQSAITDAERAGYAKFKEIGCPTCHVGVNVGGNSFQKLGLVRDYFKERGTPLTDADNGRYNFTKKEEDRHFFKVPSLRNVELTGPYLHDGSRETIEETAKLMARYQLGRELSDDDAKSIATFIRSLTGELPAHARLPEGELGKDRLAPEPPAVPPVGKEPPAIHEAPTRGKRI